MGNHNIPPTSSRQIAVRNAVKSSRYDLVKKPQVKDSQVGISHIAEACSVGTG